MEASALLAGGFKRSGCWRGTETGGIELDFDSDRAPGVYAYVVDDVVMYVGSAQRGLHRRFRNYILSQTMRTSQRVRGEIVRVLSSGRTVEIYTLLPPAHDWNGLPVDLIAGVEEGLIRAALPEWNLRGRSAGRKSRSNSLRAPLPHL